MRKEYRLTVDIVTSRYFSEEGPYGDGESVTFSNIKTIGADTIDELASMFLTLLEDNKVYNFDKKEYSLLFAQIGTNDYTSSQVDNYLKELRIMKDSGARVNDVLNSRAKGCEGYAEIKKLEIVYVPEIGDEFRNLSSNFSSKFTEFLNEKVDSFLEELKTYKKNRSKSAESEKVRKEKALLKQLKEKYEGIS